MDPEPVNPPSSGSDSFVVADSAATAGQAAYLPQLPGSDGFLPRWLDDAQWPVSVALVRSLGVVVRSVLVMTLFLVSGGLQMVQQMQHVRPQMSTPVHDCPSAEVALKSRVAA